MILYYIYSNKQLRSSIESLIKKHAPTFTNIDIKIVAQEEINSSNAELFSIFTETLQEFQLDVTSEQAGFFLTCRFIWKDFISTRNQHCIIIKDILPEEVLLKSISGIIDYLPADLDILFPFNKKNNEPAIGQHEPLEQQMEICSGNTILLELLLSDSMYALSQFGAVKLCSATQFLEPATSNNAGPVEPIEMIACYSDTGWMETLTTRSLVQKRNKKLKSFIYNSHSWTTDAKKMARDLLKEISQINTENDIDMILHGGSLLGYVRHGEIMPWDDDIDLGIHEDQLDIFLKSISQRAGLRCTKLIEERSGIYFYKVWNVQGIHIDGCSYTFPFIDVWLYKGTQDHVLFHNGIIFPHALKEPFKEVIFEGIGYKIPANYQECLDSMYSKDWRHRIIVFSYSHRLETLAKLPMEMFIKVDANGRLIEEEL